MIRVSGKRSGFTLIELLVVVGMIAILMGALTTSVTASQERARIQKATAEVKTITQAILGYENFSKNHELPATLITSSSSAREADAETLGFLLNKGETSAYGKQIPALLMASLQNGGKMRDPWGTTYRIAVTKGTIQINQRNVPTKTGYFVPNFYRLGQDEREPWWVNEDEK